LEGKNSSFRDILWDYPDTLYHYYVKSKPIGAIFISLIVGIALLLQLSQPFVLGILSSSNNSHWSEGVIGEVQVLNPMFINQNHVDRDLHELVYERLIYLDSNGDPLPGLAYDWDVSEDGRRYTLYLADDHYWHDGERLTAEDVQFTFEGAIILSNELGGNTVGSAIVDVEIELIDSYTIKFSLPESNATFFESISIHIVPKHILESYPLEDFPTYGIDLLPVGSGPYRIRAIKDNVVNLEAVDNSIYDPSIKSIDYYTFANKEALEVAFKNNILDGISGLQISDLGYLADYKEYEVRSTLLEHRKRLVFMNLNDALLGDKAVRDALSYSVDREGLIEESEVDGEVTYSPIPSNSWAYEPEIEDIYAYNPEQSVETLEAAGYKLGGDGIYVDGDGEKLKLTLTYLDSPSNQRIVDELVTDWLAAGILIETNPTSYYTLINEILATRNYQLMLFELETTIDPDQYNLWHSLKRNYPDLNISGYEYNRADLLLERARVTLDQVEREENYKQLQRYLIQDAPVVFLFESKYSYVTTTHLNDISIADINYPHERFKSIEEWELD
jgi:peptide/nickel transport system substrate-binding protein